MGYVKDNFPGSPAAIQRTWVARGVIGYAIVTGSLFYAFSPYARAHRQALKEGAWENPPWFESWKANLKQNDMKGIPTRKQLEHAMEINDKVNRGDIAGPHLLFQAERQQPPTDTSK